MGKLNGKSRGQAAMEYLMTYGWALLVIVVVIAILLVINPLQPPAGCRFDQMGFTCSDPLVDSGGMLYLKVTNGNNNNVVIKEIRCTSDKSPTPKPFTSTSFSVNLQRQETIELNTSTTKGIQCYDAAGAKLAPAAGSDFSGKLWIYYQNEEDGTSYPIRTVSANVVSKVVRASSTTSTTSERLLTNNTPVGGEQGGGSDRLLTNNTPVGGEQGGGS